MNNFMDAASRKWKAAKETTKKAKQRVEILSQLPTTLTEHDWGDASLEVVQTGDMVGLDIDLYSDAIATQEFVDGVKEYLGREVGFSFEKVSHMWDKQFQYVGFMDCNGVKIRIALRCAPKPPNCTLKAVTTTEEVTRFEAVCDDTGEEI